MSLSSGLRRSYRVELYLRALSRLACPGSRFGSALERLRDNLPLSGGGGNGIETALVALADLSPTRSHLTREDIAVLLVYHTGHGGQHDITGSGGEVLERWSSGVSHLQAARALGISGRRPGAEAARRLKAVYAKLGVV